MINNLFLKLKLSFKVLLNNKLRLFLTITGMGLGLLVMILGIESINAYTNKQYQKFSRIDDNLIMISSNTKLQISDAIYKLNKEACNYNYNYFKKSLDTANKTYTYKNKRIQCELNILAASYKFEKGYLFMNDDDFSYCDKINIIDGKSFTKKNYTNKEPVCILEKSTSQLLFGTEKTIGKKIDLQINNKNYEFTIVGIINDTPNTLRENLSINANLRTNDIVASQKNILVPISWYNNCYKNSARSTSSIIFSFENDSVNKGNSILHKAVYGTNQFQITDYNSNLESLRDFMTLVNSCVDIALLCIFLLAGLIVMNSLFFSIKERFHEFGIRRALGANSYHILKQILLESILQGILAYIFTIVIASIIFFITTYYCLYILGIDFILYIHGGTYIIIFLFAIIESIVFSFLPGIYATKIKPTEAILFT